VDDIGERDLRLELSARSESQRGLKGELDAAGFLRPVSGQEVGECARPAVARGGHPLRGVHDLV